MNTPVKKECAISGCGAQAIKRGWCNKHYLRFWRTGDPLRLRKAANGTAMDFAMDASLQRQDECLLWPFSRDYHGYGTLHFRGRSTKAHRVVCILAHGEPPFEGAHAAHSCGKGHEGCVNPRHLRWATVSENMLEHADHGTDNRGEKHPLNTLSADDVKRIRALRGQKTQRQIAAQFSTSPGYISQIQTATRRRYE